MNNQQYHYKSLTFNGCGIGIKVTHSFMAVCQGCRFENCGIGIDTTNLQSNGKPDSGTFVIYDSSATKTGALLNTVDSQDSYGSFVLENVKVDGTVSSVQSFHPTPSQGSRLTRAIDCHSQRQDPVEG